MKEKVLLYGHRKRLRGRFDDTRSTGLYDYELVELLLTFVIQRQDVKPIAKHMIKQFKDLAGILDANENELIKIKGLGQRSVTLIKLVKEFCNKYFESNILSKDVLSKPDAVVKFAQSKLGELDYEGFMIIFLNTKNEVLNYEILTEGTIDNIIVYPRRIIEKALQKNAAGCILVHNHPSGYSTPSNQDKILTTKIKDCLKMIDVNLLDHIIVSRQDHYSFQEQGLL